MTVDVPIRQDQLNLGAGGDDAISEVDLKVIRNKIGIKSITATVEEMLDPYTGSLEKLSLNLFKTDLARAPQASWACPIIGQYTVTDKEDQAAVTSIDVASKTFDVNNANDCLFSVPLTFNRDLRNMTDHKLVVEIEAQCTEASVDMRTVLNINAID